MDLTKPAALRPGDKIAAVSLSWGGPGAYPHRYQAGKEQLEREFEVELVASPHALADPDWLAANPGARAADLMEAFADPAIAGIVSTVGGDDSIRILPYLDLDIIRSNPKVFVGYSDTTVTHFACFTAGLTSFYGPSILAGFAENGGMFPYMVSAIRRTLFSTEPIGVLRPNTSGWTSEYLDWADPANQTQKRQLSRSWGWRFLQGGGRVRGPLIGGCLEVLDWLRGTRVWPRADVWRDAILFLETSEESPKPTAVLRMMRALEATGILQQIGGILLGRPYGPEEFFPAYDAALLQAIREESERPDIPIVTLVDFGHTDPMMVLPYGVTAEIDCDSREISIPESGVSQS
jgi:muramoyltetrapeptide carboxypeptidase LdcA involved in peptidoglycan recycling